MSFLSVEVSRQQWVCQWRYAVVGAKHLVDFVLENFEDFLLLPDALIDVFLVWWQKKNERTGGCQGWAPFISV